MPLITAAEARQAGLFPDASADKLDNALTNVYIPRAANRLTKWVGETAYNDAPSETPENQTRADCLKRA